MIKKPKRFKKLYAWYYRIKFKDYLNVIIFNGYKPALFEILYTTSGKRAVYLGKNQFLEVGKDNYRACIKPNIPELAI